MASNTYIKMSDASASTSKEKPKNDIRNFKTDDYPKGVCMEMCPPVEIGLRLDEKMFHILETTKLNGHKLVKSYCPVDANSEMASPSWLRPFRVLSDTIHYLLLEVSHRPKIRMEIMYDFLEDRLKAVLQDMTIQRLPPEDCVVLLEPIIRFYVYYGYRLCDEPRNRFDPVACKNSLLECIELFLRCADTIHGAVKIENEIDPSDSDYEKVMTKIYSLDMSKPRPDLSCDRILVECLYILCNLDEIHILHRYLRLPSYFKRAPPIRLAYEIAIANMKNNYIRTIRLSKKLGNLSFALFSLYLPILRRRALQVMSRAYAHARRTVPVPVLKNWLSFNCYEDARLICSHYGLKVIVENHGISFENFDDHAETKMGKYFPAKVQVLSLEDVLFNTL